MVHKQTRLVEVTHPTHYCFVEESLSWENNIMGVIYMMWIIWSINKWIMTCESRRLKAEQMFHKNKISLGEETESKFTFVTGFLSWMVRDNLCLLEWDCRDHFCSGPFIRKFQRSFLNNYSFFKQGNTMRKKKNGSPRTSSPSAKLPNASCGLKFMACRLILLDFTQITGPWTWCRR